MTTIDPPALPSSHGDPPSRLSVSSWLPPSLLLVTLIAVWEVWVRLEGTATWLLPAPSRIGTTLWEDRAILAENAWVTLVEVLLGFGLALAAGMVLGVLIDASPPLRRALYPLVVGSQTVPIPAIAPLLLIWFGYGLLPKVLVTALIGFFPLVVTTVDGLGSTDREVLDLLRGLGAGRWARFRFGKLPWALPAVFSGAKVAVSVCVIGAVFGEFVGSSAGLGYLINRSKAQFLTDRVFACLVLLALMGVGLFALVSLLERLLLPWRRVATDGRREA